LPPTDRRSSFAYSHDFRCDFDWNEIETQKGDYVHEARPKT
jgi:hypothetical protein